MAEDAGTEFSDRELLDAAKDLRWQLERIEARLLGHIAEIDRRAAFQADGAVTTVSWLKNHCRMDASRASQLVTLAKAGDQFPELRDAQLDGRITGCEARRIAHGAGAYRRDLDRHPVDQDSAAELVEGFQRTLLETAENGEGAAALRRQIDSQRHELAAESMVIDERAAFEQRELHLYTTFDGMVNVRGTLDPASAAIVRAAIESLTKPQADNRTPRQRRADALVQLARNYLDNNVLLTTGGQRPHVFVTVSEETLAAEQDAPDTPPASLAGIPGHVSGETARLFACDAEITRVVYGPNSEVLDLGRARRFVSPAMHKALRLRDGGCAYPRCDRPVEWCDAHHIDHWARGGPTSLENLVLLCRPHHTEVHLHDLKLRLEADGLVVEHPDRGPDPPRRSGS